MRKKLVVGHCCGFMNDRSPAKSFGSTYMSTAHRPRVAIAADTKSQKQPRPICINLRLLLIESQTNRKSIALCLLFFQVLHARANEFINQRNNNKHLFYFFFYFFLHAIINALGARKAILHQHDIEISISISMFPNDTKVLVDVPMLSPPKSMHFKVEVFKT